MGSVEVILEAEKNRLADVLCGEWYVSASRMVWDISCFAGPCSIRVVKRSAEGPWHCRIYAKPCPGPGGALLASCRGSDSVTALRGSLLQLRTLWRGLCRVLDNEVVGA